MNVLTATEIKRRGMGIVDPLLEKGPVHVIRNNQPKYVVLKESDYSRLVKSPTPTDNTFSIPDIKGQIRSIWGGRTFSRDETERMAQAERDREDA